MHKLMSGFASSTLVVLIAASASAQQSPVQTKPIDRANLDTTCAACTDFFDYANGGWI